MIIIIIIITIINLGMCRNCKPVSKIVMRQEKNNRSNSFENVRSDDYIINLGEDHHDGVLSLRNVGSVGIPHQWSR